MPHDLRSFLDEWHRVVAAKDLDGLAPLLAEQVSLGAPPYWPRFESREVVQHLLGVILTTIEDFTYHREWTEPQELALEFSGRVGEHELQGVDLISLDEAFAVTRLDVLMRPTGSVDALRDLVAPRMTEFFAIRGGGAG